MCGTRRVLHANVKLIFYKWENVSSLQTSAKAAQREDSSVFLRTLLKTGKIPMLFIFLLK